jgi:ATP synthase protein I
MNDDKGRPGSDGPRPDGDDFDQRLKAARARHEASSSKERDRTDADRNKWQAIGFAMRVGSELIAALITGLGIGWLLDRWLDTTPWLMALFLFVGGAAGVMNVYRLVEGQDSGIGWKRPGRDRLGSDDSDGRETDADNSAGSAEGEDDGKRG